MITPTHSCSGIRHSHAIDQLALQRVLWPLYSLINQDGIFGLERVASRRLQYIIGELITYVYGSHLGMSTSSSKHVDVGRLALDANTPRDRVTPRRRRSCEPA